jgi:hypothetical protein
VSKTHRRHEHCPKHGILESLDENNAGCIAGILAVVKQSLPRNSVETGCTQRGATACKWVADREREPVLPAVEDAPDIFKRSEALVKMPPNGFKVLVFDNARRRERLGHVVHAKLAKKFGAGTNRLRSKGACRHWGITRNLVFCRPSHSLDRVYLEVKKAALSDAVNFKRADVVEGLKHGHDSGAMAGIATARRLVAFNGSRQMLQDR